MEVGIDIIELSRIKHAMRHFTFIKKILGDDEYEQLYKKNFPIRSVAGNFCAKEAFSKSIGTGFKNFYFKDVQILRDDFGKPFIKLSNKILNFCLEKDYNFCVSISHTKILATAIVICERKLVDNNEVRQL